ncbi:MAG: tetratricopeptide repeat protein [Candidatus Aminicenantes bacterium]|jgi:tetratricopeptide (TPR) repeat protein
MIDLVNIEQNKKNLALLYDTRQQVIPFLGAGFSRPFCPGWEEFLNQYFQTMKNQNFLHKDEINDFKKLKNASADRRLEKMAGFLVEKSRGLAFKDEMKRQLQVDVPIEEVKKFHLLHKAFPYLKITTNYDTLIESNTPHGMYVKVVYGTQPEELDRLFSLRSENNSLLKIHGGVEDMNSIVLGAAQYRTLYGHAHRYRKNAKLPLFLKQVFSSCSVLFIGCSLDQDRTTMILADIRDKPRHFALVKLPREEKEKIRMNRRLNELGVCIVWLEDYDQIEEILAQLAGEGGEVSMPRLGAFVGREKELETLAAQMDSPVNNDITGRLCCIVGIGGVGKTMLAVEAAMRNRDKFEHGIMPLYRADEHTPVSFAIALAKHFGIPCDESADNEAALRSITRILQKRHCLLILDNVEKWEDLQYMIPRQTNAVILVTTRNRDIYHRLRNFFIRHQVKEIRLEKLSEIEALALFRQILGEGYQEPEIEIYLEIACILDYLPLALPQAISLMVYRPHYPARKLLELLRTEPLPLLRKGSDATEIDSRVVEAVFDLARPQLRRELIEVLEMMAVCKEGPVPADFLRRLDKTRDKKIYEELEELYTYSWLDRREIPGEGERYYALHRLVREVVRVRGPLRFLDAFIHEVHKIFTDEGVHFQMKERYYPQLEEAFDAARQRKDLRLKDWLCNAIYYFCAYRGYAHFFLRLTDAVEQLFPGDWRAMRKVIDYRALILMDWDKLSEAMSLLKTRESLWEELDDRAGLAITYGNQALILQKRGQLAEAMTLHKKEESLWEELDDRAGLARTYGNQALILADWGQLSEAMTLHKKEESLWKELGDRVGLARTYRNQALILKSWSQLAEAMTLHKKEESLWEELGNRDGLAACYGNQALILQEWGQLDKAMTLHKKNEELKKELDDRAGLAITYGNQALILKARGQLSEAMTLRKKEESLWKELDDRAGLARTYGNQALILKARGQLFEAMNLHKKEESLCEELGDRAGLARTYGNQALILADWGQLSEAMTLHKKNEKLKEELGDFAGLAACYGNQALVLQAWGQLSEAMTLHKKEESLCEELGDRAGLARTYGNQALILADWGQLPDALTLHKKEESLWEELGDHTGLAMCYDNQALILRALGQLSEAMTLHKKGEYLWEKLGDRAGLARTYGNQALILADWDKLSEAMNLHKKEESLCEELGDRAGLARTWWNQGYLYGKEGDKKTQVQLWKKSLDTNNSMGIPTKNDEKALKELLEEIKDSQ